MGKILNLKVGDIFGNEDFNFDIRLILVNERIWLTVHEETGVILIFADLGNGHYKILQWITEYGNK